MTMRKTLELLIKIKDKILLNEVNAVMQPLIDNLRSYWPAQETADNFDYFMFEALLEVFGTNNEKTPNSKIVALAKKYLEDFNTKGSSNTIRMAVKFLVFTVKNLRFAKQLSIHNHKLPYLFYGIRSLDELKTIHEYIDHNASTSALAAKFICPLSEQPITTPAVLKYDTSHHLMHPSYEYSLYELSALHNLIFFETTDINPINHQYMGSGNLMLDIKEIHEVFANDLAELKNCALKS